MSTLCQLVFNWVICPGGFEYNIADVDTRIVEVVKHSEGPEGRTSLAADQSDPRTSDHCGHFGDSQQPADYPATPQPANHPLGFCPHHNAAAFV